MSPAVRSSAILDVAARHLDPGPARRTHQQSRNTERGKHFAT